MRDQELEDLARIVVDCGFKLHVALGPGLLETVYEVILADALRRQGLAVETQKLVPITYEGRTFDNDFRADLIVEGRLLIELKSVERLAAVHAKQVLTYLRLLEMPLGLLMNFGAATFKEGIKRIANDYHA